MITEILAAIRKGAGHLREHTAHRRILRWIVDLPEVRHLEQMRVDRYVPTLREFECRAGVIEVSVCENYRFGSSFAAVTPLRQSTNPPGAIR